MTTAERVDAVTGGTGLRLDRLVVKFGGLTAVNGLSLDAPLGRVTALLGPNGAGKTTAFNVCSGLQRPTDGSVELDGRDITALSPQTRARRGLGRTFQKMELFDHATVRDNVSMGREAAMAGSLPWRQIFSTRREREELVEVTARALELCGIVGLADRRPVELSTGQRRLVELARVVAGGFSMLLLDEPSSGLDKAETQAFGEVLRKLVATTGCGILIVEHDMSLVMDLSDYIYVMEFGTPIFEGTPDEVRRSPEVRAAYLGTEGDE
ncbi:ABC transporter ATP-binding protein [Nocardioides marmoriginsengisoli]|uniref:ABC transporter ATP-binding protein n=2 Tax=Nocardioides marmoriginsengisoli TaxID=661483 RepID=A0A3N0CC95_9ACTN|nr:ABC transporter ATP-binding protein [Nocardioides marmoriginsengisoli]